MLCQILVGYLISSEQYSTFVLACQVGLSSWENVMNVSRMRKLGDFRRVFARIGQAVEWLPGSELVECCDVFLQIPAENRSYRLYTMGSGLVVVEVLRVVVLVKNRLIRCVVYVSREMVKSEQAFGISSSFVTIL